MEMKDAAAAYERIFTAYPSFREWLKNTGTPQETIDQWCRMLAGCDKEDVDVIVAQVLTGDVDVIERYDTRDLLPIRLKAKANFRRGQRRRNEDNERLSQATRAKNGQRVEKRSADFMAKLNRYVAFSNALKNDTATQDDVDTAHAAMMTEHERLEETDDEYGPRYSCRDCQDLGSVPCLDPDLVALVMRKGTDALEGRHIKIVSYACACEFGKALRYGADTSTYKFNPLKEYDPRYHFRMLAMTPAQIPQLESWLEVHA